MTEAASSVSFCKIPSTVLCMIGVLKVLGDTEKNPSEKLNELMDECY